MTDTTDTAELRIKAANVIGLLTAESLTGSFALDSLADVFDDMFRLLEAERHKGDLWFGKVADLEAALKAERQRADEGAKEITYWCNLNARSNERMGALEAEIAELKGDQVPEVSLAEHCKHASEIVDTWPQWKRNGADVTKFTAPQKPVVLPDGYKPCVQRGGQQSTSYRAVMNFGGDWLHRDMVMEAIEAAGGKVAK